MIRKLSYSRDATQRRLRKLGLHVLIKEDEDYVQAKLMRGSRKVGLISVYSDGNEDDNFWFVDSSKGIQKKYRGKGIGLYMYEELLRHCLKKGYHVYSDTSRSHDANRVWDKLKKRFFIRRTGPFCATRYRVYRRRL
jgi:L-amino acid N-acyltransferase YncA